MFLQRETVRMEDCSFEEGEHGSSFDCYNYELQTKARRTFVFLSQTMSFIQPTFYLSRNLSLEAGKTHAL